jgi:hypothetical protein
MRTPWYVFFAKYYSVDKIKYEMGGIYGTYGGQEMCVYGFGGEC